MKIVLVIVRLVFLVAVPLAIAYTGAQIVFSGQLTFPDVGFGNHIVGGVPASLVGVAICFVAAYLHLIAREYVSGENNPLVQDPSLLLWGASALLAASAVWTIIPWPF